MRPTRILGGYKPVQQHSQHGVRAAWAGKYKQQQQSSTCGERVID